MKKVVLSVCFIVIMLSLSLPAFADILSGTIAALSTQKALTKA